MNNTPRTDAELFLSRGMGIVPTLPKQSVPANLARTLERELAAVTKERDRLAEAFQDMLNDTLTPTNDEWIVTDNENYIEIASIKTCDSIASVHGGKTIGDQYDLAGRIARVPQLERELTAVTEKLKETQKHLKDANRGAEINAHALRINADKLIAVTEQRDRLVEGLKWIAGWNHQLFDENTAMQMRDKAEQTLADVE